MVRYISISEKLEGDVDAGSERMILNVRGLIDDKVVLSSLVCPTHSSEEGGEQGVIINILPTPPLFHLYAQSTLGVYGSECQAETGTKGECASANMSNEAWVMLKAGVPVPWTDPEVVYLGLNTVRARKPLTMPVGRPAVLIPPVFIAAGIGAVVVKLEPSRFNGAGRRILRAFVGAGVFLTGSGSTGAMTAGVGAGAEAVSVFAETPRMSWATTSAVTSSSKSLLMSSS